MVAYVQALETNYTERMRGLKEKNERLSKQVRQLTSSKATEVSAKSDMEHLFIECIEEVRKEVMRRRFRQEVAAQKRTGRLALRSQHNPLNNAQLQVATGSAKTSMGNSPKNSGTFSPKSIGKLVNAGMQTSTTLVTDQEAQDFEESLYKLAQLSRKKVRIEDFTARDRFIILDLFVNNEKTLLKIYEALFPPRGNKGNSDSVERNQNQ